jgi:DNA-binding CsgD family transcriptional regulator
MFNFLSIKSPWYDDENHIAGVFGCSIVLGQHSLAESLSAIVQLGLFDSDKLPTTQQIPPSNFKINNAYLSKREIECLKLTIKGYTAKRIGQELTISYRTVEDYLNNIKMKTGTSSKAELIELTVNSLISVD